MLLHVNHFPLDGNAAKDNNIATPNAHQADVANEEKPNVGLAHKMGFSSSSTSAWCAQGVHP